LSCLKFLNLSSNQIETVQTMLFDSLFKLETLDLSLNRIRFIKAFALNQLLNLRNLHLNENSNETFLIESNDSFSHLNSIQNIFIFDYIPNEENTKIFLNLFEAKQRGSIESEKSVGHSFF
jgi:Leucine-rich repeat (LRR) protein